MPRSILLLCALMALTTPAAAQQGLQQGGITVPAYTDQQRWARTSFHAVSFYIAGIAAFKARGQTAEDYARLVGDLFAPGWGSANSGSALRVARGWLFNWIAFPESQAEILSANDTAVTMRYRRFHVAAFGPQRTSYSVTLDEYDRATSIIGERIASYLGLRFHDRIDGDWNVVTITGRGSAAVLEFPRVVYGATFTAQDIADNPQLAGAFESTYLPDGRFTVRHNGEAVIEGNYDLALDQIVFRDERGTTACPKAGTYRWTVNPANGNLSLGRLSDECDPRFRYLTRRPFAKK